MLEDAARVGLLSPIGGGMYQIHPALPGYLAAAWQAEDPGGYERGTPGSRAGPARRLRRVQRVADRADRIRGRRPRLHAHRAAAADPGGDARPCPRPPDLERRRPHRPSTVCILGDSRPERRSRRLGRPHPGRHHRPRPRTDRILQIAVVVHPRPAGCPAAGRRATGRGRQDLPADPRLAAGPACDRMDPWQHRRHLPPARQHCPGPGTAGRSRRLVSQIPPNQRRTRQPPWHGDQLSPARHYRPAAGTAGRSRRLVPQIAGH